MLPPSVKNDTADNLLLKDRKENDIMNSQRTYSTIASFFPQANSSACNRAIFTTH